MKRIVAGAFLVLLSLGTGTFVLPAQSGAAPAQVLESCFPSGDPGYPPTSEANTVEPLVLVRGHFTPGGRAQIVIEGAISGDFYCGTAYSTPIALPTQAAVAGGRLNYDVAVPGDFELNAMHHIDVFKASHQVGAFDFCVATSGDIVALSGCQKSSGDGGDLPKTGTNHLWDIIRAALVLLALAAAAFYGRRRMQGHRTA